MSSFLDSLGQFSSLSIDVLKVLKLLISPSESTVGKNGGSSSFSKIKSKLILEKNLWFLNFSAPYLLEGSFLSKPLIRWQAVRLRLLGNFGLSFTIDWKTSIADSPSKGTHPTRVSYKKTPKENQSLSKL